ncbi:MAG: response regulator [Candidatus Omnitrophica bacterium]|nr:response regulator [Candidatus Omnitrophota bacterium]
MAKILIIDDDNDFAEATKIILESRNYEVISADNTKEGLLLLENENPDLLILDIMMENKAAGIIISRQLRKNPKFQKLPILMLTGMREQTGFFFPDEPKSDTFLPVNEFLEKPSLPEILLEKVEKLLMK